jgi:hypothetical protein
VVGNSFTHCRCSALYRWCSAGLSLVAGVLFGVTRILLIACWIISGVAAGYLLYRWYEGGQKLFGHKDHLDTVTFLVLCISGLNLGFAGVFGKNLGMTICRTGRSSSLSDLSISTAPGIFGRMHKNTAGISYSPKSFFHFFATARAFFAAMPV